MHHVVFDLSTSRWLVLHSGKASSTMWRTYKKPLDQHRRRSRWLPMRKGWDSFWLPIPRCRNGETEQKQGLRSKLRFWLGFICHAWVPSLKSTAQFLVEDLGPDLE
jgi:hypothetical protein